MPKGWLKSAAEPEMTAGDASTTAFVPGWNSNLSERDTSDEFTDHH